MNAKKTNLEHQPGALDPSYLLTYFINEKQIDDTFTDWPLHVTIIPWFKVKAIELVDQALGQIAISHQPITVTGSERDNFGGHDVCLLEPAELLRGIHKYVYATLQGHGARFISTEFFGDNYNPHVTTQGDDVFDVGEQTVLNGFYLVKRHRDQVSDRYTKTVACEYHFNA